MLMCHSAPASNAACGHCDLQLLQLRRVPMATSDAIKTALVGTSPASQQAVLRRRACGMLMATVVPPGPSLSKYSGMEKRHLSHSSLSACSGEKAGTRRVQLSRELATQPLLQGSAAEQGQQAVSTRLLGMAYSAA